MTINRHRTVPVLLAMLVMAIGSMVWASPVAAAPGTPAMPSVPTRAPANMCSTEEWRNPANFQSCVDRLSDVSADRASCLKAPTASAPDSGMAGWFASRPDSFDQPGPKGSYTYYGYAGYNYTTYDIGCVSTLMHPDYKFGNTVANGEFMFATSIVGASNALRERA